MHDMLEEKVLPVFTRLAAEASEVILSVYETEFDVEEKEDRSPLTLADKLANDLIVEGLKSAFPGIPILAEESADDLIRLNAAHVFLVDPLDGTKEFVRRSGEFTVNIALVAHGKPIAGIIHCPVGGDAYVAGKGLGAWVIRDGAHQRIKVSDRRGDIRLMASRSHGMGPVEALIHENGIRHVMHAGSALKGCRIAEGLAEAYYRFGRTMEWDTAAMQILIEEAGGVMRRLDGGELMCNKVVPDNPEGFYVLNAVENRLILPAL